MYKCRHFIRALLVNRKIFQSVLPCSTMAADHDCKGVPMSHIIGSQSPWGAPEFPLIQPGFDHAVLYHIPGSGTQLDRPPKPQIGKEKWDHEHVRMPFSKHSLYPVPNDAGKSDLRSRWEMIKDALNKPIRNSTELEEAILSYNTQFKDRWHFQALHKLFDTLDEEESQYFFDVTLPEIVKLALALPKLIQSPIPLLKQHKNRSVSLSQQQISSLLANAFFCTFPRRNTYKKDAEYSKYPHINFNVLYNTKPSSDVLEKLKCICHYFRRVCQKVPVGVLTFARRSVAPRAQPHWPASDRPLSTLPLHVDPENTIEDAHGLIQVDFANKFLGGGVLGYGSVQEEIRFVICPELLISMLFTECLRPNEALMMIGCEQFSTYTGYGHSFQWAGDFADETPYDSSGRRRCAVLAIDAMPFHSKLQEYRKEAVNRELNKAWVGFSFYTPDDPGPHYPGVATGNWGCGAFGGTAALKTLIQMMALTQAGRPMAYYTFGDTALRDSMVQVYNLLVKHGVTVGGLYGLILEFCKTDVLKTNVYRFLEKVLDGAESSNNSQSVKTKTESMNLNTETEQYSLPLSVELALDRSPDMFDDVDFHFDDFDITLAKLKVKNKIQKTFNNVDDIGKNEVKIEMSRSLIEVGNQHNMSTSPEKIVDNDHKMSTSSNSIGDSNLKMSTGSHKIGDSDYKMSTCSNKMADPRLLISPDKKVENMKTPNQTSRLFQEMEKLDENSGKLNLKSPHSSVFGQKAKQKETAENSKISTPKVRLFNEGEKVEDNSRKSDFESPQKSHQKHSAMDVDDKILTEVSPDVKKKLTRKITDYFSKKPI
ncbi:poly(ADP-ribose) glycohydrolase [Bicyclus anynana]|uniref:poly(ADP-ribose) glycohydrolase n=1 Tax=Bicyclus anynana TaxID=110368 RepID=A0A6J1MYD1_BICAN|nr:poly(ADP-ribose) glycohydrolase [Bicyclus anynana]